MTFNFDEKQFNNHTQPKVLYKKIASDTITPVLASLKLFSHFKDYHFLFESVENNKNGNHNKGRFSVIGLDPDVVWKCRNNQSFINHDFDKKRDDFVLENGAILENFRQLINNSQISWDGLNYGSTSLPAICSGLFGYFGYDMVRLMENLPSHDLPDELDIADSIFIRPQILIIFDNFYDCALICAPIFADNKKSFAQLKDKILYIEKILNLPHQEFKTKDKIEFDFSSNYSKNEFCDAVIKSKKYIRDGDIFQVLPSQRFVSHFDKKIPEFEFYRALRRVNPSPFLFFLKFDDFSLTGSSPEIMASCKNRKVIIRPLAGTRKRGKNFEEDKIIAKNLLEDEKEIAEHLMLIDLGRHDVGSVCKAGSVKLTEKMVIEYYSHVMHISSNIEGILRDDLESLDALIAGFPAGTVSGAPKIRAMQIIEEIEKIRRSFYAGCVGYFAGNGDMETCITLRSALIKDAKIYLQAGAGVVYDSNPESEYQECINKAQALIKACELLKETISE